MGIEHFYWFIDREVIDPVLEMRWKTFLRKYYWDRDCLNETLSFAVEPEPDASTISDILKKRSLRWTMKHSSPAYWFLNTVVYHVPALERRCLDVSLYRNLYEIAILDAAAVEGFLEGRISERALWAVNNIELSRIVKYDNNTVPSHGPTPRGKRVKRRLDPASASGL